MIHHWTNYLAGVSALYARELSAIERCKRASTELMQRGIENPFLHQAEALEDDIFRDACGRWTGREILEAMEKFHNNSPAAKPDTIPPAEFLNRRGAPDTWGACLYVPRSPVE